MSNIPEPEKTREIRPPQPDGPTRNIPTPARHPNPPPPPPPRRPNPPPPPAGAAPPQRAELPWWQTINRDAPTPAASANPPPPQRVSPPPAPNPHSSKAAPRRPVRPTVRPAQPSPPHVVVPPPKQSRRALLLSGGAVAAVGAAVAIGIVLAGTKTPAAVLDVTDAQRGVELVLRDPVEGYGLSDIGPVLCNDGRNPAVEQGTGFECTVSVDGVQRQVSVVFQDDQATYAVDRPR